MAGAVIDASAIAICAHAGQVHIQPGSGRVQIGGVPVATVASPAIITGCTAGAGRQRPDFCTAVQWLDGATRVHVAGVPLLLQSSIGLATPLGSLVQFVNVQQRVFAQ